ncbi:hypothetical protein A5634_13145 [Mycobacterium asiaticum]|uniref:DUF4407 domain-containing protein n=1 Tax=Mycobacterium asiaticum TaxID=1790 RepID=A0A1A3PBL3_MYCAS|nr:DUF4407 domain-containing protein [Mycobacterium asiaticum]OBK31536.1 hypothetical protein A5634_13145 [Mycobacterium asiaticum]
MGVHESTQQRSGVSRSDEPPVTRAITKRAITRAPVLLGAALAWLVAALAVGSSVGAAMPTMPMWAIVALTLVFGLLVGAVTRGIAGGPDLDWRGLAGRAAVAVAVGVVVGELAALVMFSGAVDHRLEEKALRTADTAPAVAQATASLQQARASRSALDTAVEQARGQLDNALVVARCEYNPSPACPQTRITGIPGRGPEARTANELLADAQRELGNALATRDRQAPERDAAISHEENSLADARSAVVANAGNGLGARWVAMNDLTLASPGALALRILTIAFFALLYLLPLILRMWRGETTHDRHAAAHAERERAELDADTAIAVKRAEVRRAAEIMWAEHQLVQTRLAIEAQAEIDREHHRRRVVEALDAPVHATSERTFEPVTELVSEPVSELVEEDMYLPIAAEAEAASRARRTDQAELPAAPAHVPENLPAPVQPDAPTLEHYQEPATNRGTPLIPSIPDATKAAARWIRPLVPPFVARVIDNTTAPLRSARQVFEEVEEIAFSLKRTRKVTVDSESSEPARTQQQPLPAVEAPGGPVPGGPNRIDSTRGHAAHPHSAANYGAANYGSLGGEGSQASLGQTPPPDLAGLSVGSSAHEGRRELAERQGPRELRAPEGPRQLPPGK